MPKILSNCLKVLLIISYLFILATFNASAQTTIAYIQITEVIESKFPEVIVQAIIHDGNGEPIPVSDLDNLELLEDNEPVSKKSYKQLTAGVEVMFVLDLGLGINSYGATSSDGDTRNSRLEEIRMVVDQYASRMGAEDTAGIVTVKPDDPEPVAVYQPLTSDANLIHEQVENLSSYPKTQSSGLDGIEKALDVLSDAQARHSDVVQAIVFISSGIQTDENPVSERMSDLSDNAKKLGVPIHTIMVNYADQTLNEYRLQQIAHATEGLYTHYTNQADILDIFDWLSNQRTQYQFQFRSKSSSDSDRVIELRSGGEFDTTAYRVDLLPPEVEISSPENNDNFVRQAESYDSDMDEVEDTSTQIIARVRWDDGYPRDLTQAQLWINGSQYGSSIPNPDPNSIQFTWNLKPYNTQGIETAQIEVKAQDELGLSGISNPVTAQVEVIIPPKPTSTPISSRAGGPGTILPADLCAGLSSVSYIFCRFNTMAGWFALGVALLALAMVVVFRGRLAGAAVQMGDAVRETIARITRPPQTEVGAQLLVLRGAEDLPRNKFPIYINTVTTIGRDKRQAELVFDEDAEKSVISRLHAEITETGGQFTIRDLGSTHGTYINGERLPELGIYELVDGDQIELGPVERGGIMLSFELYKDIEDYTPPEDADLPDRKTEPLE